MKTKTLRQMASASLVASAIACALPAFAQTNEKTPAFPGAEGFGRYTTGGRGGKVYHVTNLNSAGNGSLRWALSQPGPRTIVFDVSGTIHLTEGLRIPENTTVAGQTAPGDGICVADYPVSLSSNTIVRYMRFRLGNTYVTKKGADGWDGLGAMDSENIIVDHCSVSWSIDECCSLLGNHNTTLQWSIVAQSLVDAGHSKGSHGYGGNWGGSGASFHHNLVAHHGSRTPRLGPRPTTQLDERMDMRNNVIYNFGGNGCYGGEGMTVNIVNNYYKPGPGSPTGSKGKRIAGVGVRTEEYCTTYPDYRPALHLWGKYFVEGNVNSKYADVTRDNWNYGVLQQIDRSASATDGTWNDQVAEDIHAKEEMWFVTTTTHSAEDAYERVLDYAGASLSRDSHDALMVYDTRNGVASYTGKGNGKGFINSQEDNKPYNAPDNWNAWPTLNSTEAPLDSDRDGMPDEWERQHGLDPTDSSDRNLMNDEGYTMLELYLASLVEDITAAQNAGGTEEGGIVEYDPIEDSYDICVATRIDGTWGFGHDITLSNSSNGGYTTKGDYIGVGRDQDHLITLPGGAVITWIKFEGMGRYTSSSYTDAKLVELAGTSYEDGRYSLPKGDTPAEFAVAIPDGGIKHNLSMRWTGNNPYLRITLYTTEVPATLGVIGVAVDEEASSDDSWYNLQGIRVSHPSTPGIYIHRGKKIIIR